MKIMHRIRRAAAWIIRLALRALPFTETLKHAMPR